MYLSIMLTMFPAQTQTQCVMRLASEAQATAIGDRERNSLAKASRDSVMSHYTQPSGIGPMPLASMMKSRWVTLHGSILGGTRVLVDQKQYASISYVCYPRNLTG